MATIILLSLGHIVLRSRFVIFVGVRKSRHLLANMGCTQTNVWGRHVYFLGPFGPPVINLGRGDLGKAPVGDCAFKRSLCWLEASSRNCLRDTFLSLSATVGHHAFQAMPSQLSPYCCALAAFCATVPVASNTRVVSETAGGNAGSDFFRRGEFSPTKSAHAFGAITDR